MQIYYISQLMCPESTHIKNALQKMCFCMKMLLFQVVQQMVTT